MRLHMKSRLRYCLQALSVTAPLCFIVGILTADLLTGIYCALLYTAGTFLGYWFNSRRK